MNDVIIAKSQGKKIKLVEVYDDDLNIIFEDNTGIRLFDDGQCCCEKRYMNCDDDLSFFKDSIFSGIELGECEENNIDDYGVQEIQFVKVNTSKGTFTLANYNENNGYYSGFDINVKEI